MKADEESIVGFDRVFEFHPSDGAVGLNTVLKELFGWADMKWPTYISIDVGVGEQVSVPWGKLQLPGIHGILMMGKVGGDFNPQTSKWEPERFRLNAETCKRDLPKLEIIADLLDGWVKQHSIYRGKAIDCARKFVDLSKIDPADLTFGPDVQAQIETSIFTPLEHAALCTEAGIPLKRGVLLYGPPGCGKTLTAYATAVKATKANWTFLYGRPQDNIAELIAFADQYQPAVVFMEDIDAEISGEKRTARVNEILNVVDGLISKNRQMMLILTTPGSGAEGGTL